MKVKLCGANVLDTHSSYIPLLQTIVKKQKRGLTCGLQ